MQASAFYPGFSSLISILASVSVLALAACTEQEVPADHFNPAPAATQDGTQAKNLPTLPTAKAKEIATGRLHACALTMEGAVRCWGYSDHGQIGNGAISDLGVAVPQPAQVTGLESGVQAISTYDDHTCAITASGGVKCWGADNFGQLGTGIPYTDSRPQLSAVPVDAKGLSSVRQISVGALSACAVTESGALKCWGKNEAGLIGNGQRHIIGDLDAPDFLPPTDVVGLGSGVTEVSVGYTHACAVINGGALKCWGDNSYGELGLGEEKTSAVFAEPQDVTAVGLNVAHVAAGWNATCVVMKDGTARCFGSDEKGQLGDGKSGTLRKVTEPVAVVGLTAVTYVARPGGDRTCAIAAGAVKCMGFGRIGQGDDPNFTSYVPVQSLDLTSGWTAVGVGGLGDGNRSFNCALSDQGAVRCWGDNSGGMLGDGKGGVTGLEESTTAVSVLSFQ